MNGRYRTVTGRLGGVVLLAAAALPLPAHGVEGWELLVENGSTACFFKRDTLAAAPVGRNLVAIKRVFKNRLMKRPSARHEVELDCMGNPLPRGERPAMAYAVDSIEFDCRSNQFRTREIIIYDQAGNIVNRFQSDDQPVPVPDATYLATARDRVCR